MDRAAILPAAIVPCLLLVACASEPKSKGPAVVAAPAPKPHCPPGSADAPEDAKSRMASLDGEVRRCFALSTGGEASTVRVEVTVAQEGAVRDAKVMGAAQASAVQCLVKSMKATKFAKFCGADVTIGWSYALR